MQQLTLFKERSGEISGSIYSRLPSDIKYDPKLILDISNPFEDHQSNLSEILSLLPNPGGSNGLLYQNFFVRSNDKKWKINHDSYLFMVISDVDSFFNKRSKNYQNVFRALIPDIIWNCACSGTAHFAIGDSGWLITKLIGGNLRIQ